MTDMISTPNIENIKLEPMEERHIDDLVAIEQACFSRPWSHDGFLGELENDTAVFYAAVCGERAVGYIGFHKVLDECYVANIAVLPEFRRNGIGAVMLNKAIAYCEEASAAFLSLEVRKSNVAAIALYKKFGFEAVGERKNFYSAPIEDACIMTRFF